MAPYKSHELFSEPEEMPTAEIKEERISSCNELFLQLVNAPEKDVIGQKLSAFSAKFASDDDGTVSSFPIQLQDATSPQTVFIKPRHRPPVCVALTVHNTTVHNTADVTTETTKVTLVPLTSDLYHEQREIIRRYEASTKLWHVAVWDHNHLKNTVYISRLFNEIYGVDVEEELTFQTAGQFIHPDDRDMEAVLRAHDPAGDGWFDKAFRIIRRDGQVRWLHSRSQTLFGEVDGKPGCIRTVGAMVDFTDEYLLRIALEENKQKLADILDSLPSIVLGVNKDACITQWNKMAAQRIGIAETDTPSLKLDAAFPMLQGEMPRIRKAMDERTALSLLRITEMDNQSTSFYTVSITPTHNSKDFCAVVRIDDVSEQVRIEQMLVQSEKLLSVGGLAAGMAHEINNPLAAVIQSAQVIQSRFDLQKRVNQEAAQKNNLSLDSLNGYLTDRKIYKMVETIGDAANRAAAIVNNMLGFVRVSTHKHAQCHVKELIDTTLELALNDYDLKKKYDFRKIKIQRKYDEGRIEAFCDSGKIQQVLLNLIRNAGQAIFSAGTPSPEIRIRVQNDGQFTRIEFEDNGPGVPDDIVSRIFEPFFTTKPVGEGTGLGLSISYAIITKEHGGSMRFEKGADGGAKFIIALPKHAPLKEDD